MNLYADRLRPRDPKYATEAFDGKDLIRRLIGRGLRAQLRTGNLLTGQRYVALDFFPDSAAKGKPAEIDNAPANARGLPEMPTVIGSLEDLQVTIGNIAKKIDKIPFDEIAV